MFICIYYRLVGGLQEACRSCKVELAFEHCESPARVLQKLLEVCGSCEKLARGLREL
jgi:hypothetical protein